jgi:uncharacterized protein YqjF (DUF2071 family)
MASAEPDEQVHFPVLRGGWLTISFLHWRHDAAVIQAMLPAGLQVDTFDGSAWVSMTPFLMADQRPPLLPTAGRLGTFPETNLRTYVCGPNGREGIWFFSLEAASAAMVFGARTFAGVPYHRGTLSIDERDGLFTYAGVRRGGSPSYRLVVRPGAPVEASEHDVWLTARWRAYSRHVGRLIETPITHAPWPLRAATVVELDQTLTSAAGLPGAVGDPLVHYSDGVRDVRVGVSRIVA